MKRKFLVVCHDVRTDGAFSLNDLPGSGRVDVCARCVVASLLISYGIRKDTEVILHLSGEPTPGISIRINGSSVKYLNPDERSTAALIRNALLKYREGKEVQSSPGVFVWRAGLEDILRNENVYYLKENGTPLNQLNFSGDAMFVLGDHKDLTPEEEQVVRKYARAAVSVSPISLYSEQCITIVHNYLDMLEVK
jgi:tRNA (pseudouridine54-N1)-methyltransferase